MILCPWVRCGLDRPLERAYDGALAGFRCNAVLRHMSPVSPVKQQAVAERLRALGVREEDLEERFVRSSGKGGQNVNKVATCVVLQHRPTGTMVKCQQERSQALNRFRARQLLADKIERQLRGAASAEAHRIAQLRRQKRRRSRRAQEKVLEAKHARAETKALRRPVSGEGD
ncbi:MAG: peptide chain release factor [Deltaproteobacteria bacterium]|nr:peptide chain release factor [Deltaproteobacteria bacterium]